MALPKMVPKKDEYSSSSKDSDLLELTDKDFDDSFEEDWQKEEPEMDYQEVEHFDEDPYEVEDGEEEKKKISFEDFLPEKKKKKVDKGEGLSKDRKKLLVMVGAAAIVLILLFYLVSSLFGSKEVEGVNVKIKEIESQSVLAEVESDSNLDFLSILFEVGDGRIVECIAFDVAKDDEETVLNCENPTESKIDKFLVNYRRSSE